jgi:RNA polymerase sigma-70 factor (ECF subfamily)
LFLEPPSVLLETAKPADRDAFQQLAEPYRRELQLHCYRMLGSYFEAEDLVQETFLRAWRARERFEGRTSFRNWLYRIATNACLNALASRPKSPRVLTDTSGSPADAFPEAPATDIAWLEPYPDSMLDGIADAMPGPDARYEMRESVRLAFVAAIQQLPPRQRAVLLLRDVLGWSALETAQLLDVSVAAANSALQRARATLGRHYPDEQLGEQLAVDARQRALLDRYVHAWEDADLDGFVALLRDDALLTMPPYREWYRGRQAIRGFFAWVWRTSSAGPFLLVPTAANGQRAYAQYDPSPNGQEWRAHALQVLTQQEDALAELTVFRDTRLFAAFGLAQVLPRQPGADTSRAATLHGA